MNKPTSTSKDGFSAVEAVIALLVVAVLGVGGWWAWNKNQSSEDRKQTTVTKTDKTKASDETAAWTSVRTQAGAFTMRVPDGWTLTNYPDNFLGSTEVTYVAGKRAVIQTIDNPYSGHLLKFRASVVSVDDAGFGPQWSSPQSGLSETTQDFQIGTMQGKRYKGAFSGLHQTLYEYVFDLGDGKKLDIVYTVYDDQGQQDDVMTVEKAIQTIHLDH